MEFRNKNRWPLLLLVLTVSLVIGWAAIQRSTDKRSGRIVERKGLSPLSLSEEKLAIAVYIRTCAACHGEQLEGGVGPSLANVGSRRRMTKIERIIHRGKGKNKSIPMPAGLTSPDEARLLARWLVAGPKIGLSAHQATP